MGQKNTRDGQAVSAHSQGGGKCDRHDRKGAENKAMTLAEFKQMLEQTELPVAYYEFKDKAPKLPFIVYLETNTNNFASDGVVYHEIKRLAVELYCANRDLTLEQKLEAIFKQNGIFWEKEFEFLEDEKCYEIIYEMEI
jgi:hypothetical protein